MQQRRIWWPGAAVVGALVVLGTTWAFQRGANDFNVFYAAWKLAWNGQGPSAYGGTPDRFLYAPGFAWLFAPLGALDRDLALAIWCCLKAGALGLLFRCVGGWVGGLAFVLGTLTVARPLLIDFQYGQVNLLIVAICVWALAARGSAFRWGALAIAATVKIFPLPLLLVPFFATSGLPAKKVRLERLGTVGGLALILLLPAVSVGFSGLPALYSSWFTSLLHRGLPIETHNQSATAFMLRILGSEPSPYIALHQKMAIGLGWLSRAQIDLLALGWVFCWIGGLAGWIVSGPKNTASTPRWIAIAIGAVIIPSHLVWKPYFVLSLPLAAVVWRNALLEIRSAGPEDARVGKALLAALVFALFNLTGFDFVGYELAARLEASSAMMFAHLLLLGLALSDRNG